MKFLDEAKIYIKSGAGGCGAVSFHRSRLNPYGGPDGGNGGKGADVCLLADPSLNTLVDYRFARKFVAETGQSGRGARCAGAAGRTLMLRVPVGTRALDETKEQTLAEVSTNQEVSLIYPGGRGGLGNSCFKSSTNRAPRRTIAPQEGIGGWIWLQMQLVADVGLVGFPNAGKSSLLSAVSRAKPKIGSYPFTTLYPNLGVVHRNYKEVIVEDIPGLIEGASQGKGLGDRFLLHAEKCKVFVHVISLEEEDLAHAYRTVRGELEIYNQAFMDKNHIIVLTKSDLLTAEEVPIKLAQLDSISVPKYVVSAYTSQGLEGMLDSFLTLVESNV